MRLSRSLALAAPYAALAALALLAGCAPANPPPPPLEITIDAACATAADCEDSPALTEQVRRDTQAILAGMAHARDRMGRQDATP